MNSRSQKSASAVGFWSWPRAAPMPPAGTARSSALPGSGAALPPTAYRRYLAKAPPTRGGSASPYVMGGSCAARTSPTKILCALTATRSRTSSQTGNWCARWRSTRPTAGVVARTRSPGPMRALIRCPTRTALGLRVGIPPVGVPPVLAAPRVHPRRPPAVTVAGLRARPAAATSRAYATGLWARSAPRDARTKSEPRHHGTVRSGTRSGLILHQPRAPLRAPAAASEQRVARCGRQPRQMGPSRSLAAELAEDLFREGSFAGDRQVALAAVGREAEQEGDGGGRDERELSAPD